MNPLHRVEIIENMKIHTIRLIVRCCEKRGFFLNDNYKEECLPVCSLCLQPLQELILPDFYSTAIGQEESLEGLKGRQNGKR